MIINVKFSMTGKDMMSFRSIMRFFDRNIWCLWIFVFSITLLQSGICSVAGAQWRPTKSIEFVVMGGEGGGADQATRFIVRIIQTYKLTDSPITIVNKGGNSGAEALSYLKEQRGNNHLLMFTLNTFFIAPLRQLNIGVDISEYAPIARMAEDTFLLWVHSDQKKINSLQDFIKAVNQAYDSKEPWVMSGTGLNSEDSMLTDFLNAQFKINMKYEELGGGGAVAKRLIEKKAQSTVNNPAEILAFYKAGKAKPIASFTSTRLPGFPDTPTFRELGFDFEYTMQRAVVGPPGMRKDAEAYYTELLWKVFNTPEWQQYRRDNSLQGKFLSGAALLEYWLRQRKMHQVMLLVTDLIKDN